MNYVYVHNPNNSIQMGMTSAKLYKGFLKDPNYAENFANVYKHRNLKKLKKKSERNAFVSNMKHDLNKLTSYSQKKHIKNFMMKHLNENTIFHNLLTYNDRNEINNKGNSYILSKNYKSNIINKFLNYPYSTQQRAWNSLLQDRTRAKNMARKELIRDLEMASRTPLPNV